MSGTAEPLVPLGATEVHDLWSDAVGDQFRVFVGHCGPEPQAVLFVSDANGLFGTAVDTVRMMRLPALLPAVLVVGIGYPSAATITDTLVLRVRDFTPTPSRHFPGSGGAGAFLEFIRTELIPWVGARWPSAARTLYFGHSLGGLFGAHALLTEPATFDDLIISSPSLWWGRRAPLTWEEQWAIDHDDLVARVYVGIGGLETDEGRRQEAVNLPDDDQFKPPPLYLDMVADVIRFADALKARRYPSLSLGVDVFPGEFHATVAPIVLNRGLRALLGPA